MTSPMEMVYGKPIDEWLILQLIYGRVDFHLITWAVVLKICYVDPKSLGYDPI